MEFTSYQLTGSFTSSLNTGSYLNRVEYALFNVGIVSDIWYGFSDKDVIEVGVWDYDQNLIKWNILNQSKTYNPITLSYIDTLNRPSQYSYNELIPDFILYKNQKILVSPPEELSASFQILTGSYQLTYNFTREMAGNPNNPLVIKDISPSRKEIKLVPLHSSTPSYEAFCKQKVLIKDILPLYMELLKGCPYSQIYSQVAPLYPKEIETLKSVFFLNSDAATVLFFKNLYEDFYIYNKRPNVTDYSKTTDTLVRVQGIRTYFNNYLLSNTDTIVDFYGIDTIFKGFVSASVERKFVPIGPNPSKQYVDAKAFVFDFFTKYFYNPISDKLTTSYNEKYYSPLKNALNFGNNRLLPIINNGVMDERIESNDPLTLLIKLQSELPSDIQIQTPCWISNVSLVPYVINGIFRTSSSPIVHKIGIPNFSIPIPNTSLTNNNLSYTSDDLTDDDETTRELTISKNISELSVDYTNFENFIVFSSAEVRLKIFKNKVINISNYSSSIDTLNNKNILWMTNSSSVYPYYTEEYTSIQTQMNDIVNSFDGYESYLYKTGNYIYRNSNFISSSYVVEMDLSASAYDEDNRDSLINNCPEHILTNSENDDYVIFLTMIGHFFDNIYIYISNMPCEKQVGHNSTEEFTRRVVDYMLQTFGWNLSDSLDQSSILNNYLNSEQVNGLNSMSAEERLKEVRNRILINLPQIYKTKGTVESVKMILACYGIPSTLLSIREYGGVNYTDEKASYTTYEKVFMRQWNTSSKYDTYYLQSPTSSYTYLFKLSIDDAEPYAYDRQFTLVGNTPHGSTYLSSSSPSFISGSGQWAIGFERVPRKNCAKMFFRLGYITNPSLILYSSEFPLFDGSIYSVMLRRNLPDTGFEYTSDVNLYPTKYDLYVQKNEGGEQMLRITASVVNYNTQSNTIFSGGGWIHIGGWFSDWNGGGYTGCFDKFQIWRASLSDEDFETYVNNINSYAFNASYPHQSLMFRMHSDYPFNQRQYPTGSSDNLFGVPNTDWRGIWKNGNPYFATGSNDKLISLYGWGANVDYMINYGAWDGEQKLVPNSCSLTGYSSQSCYPYQFKVIDYPSTWAVSKYGPNRFRNEKIRYVSQSIEARFDNQGRSTYISPNSISPDSNQIGLFVDPQDFKNRDIIRYLGNFDLMDSIGDPSNQYSESYNSLRNIRKEYTDSHTPFSGSKTLFNELCTLYKLYFDKSVFESIKNVIPARSNALLGVLIEPTIIERPKYQSKPIFSEVNSGSSLYADCIATHYYRSPSTNLYTISSSHAPQVTTSIDMTSDGLPTRTYPVNYSSYVVNDYPDIYEMGHFAGGVLSAEELEPLFIVPYASFTANGSTGIINGTAAITIQFMSNGFNNSETEYYWTFGDGTSSTEKNPLHTYSLAGNYTVKLITISNGQTAIKEIPSMINVTAPAVVSNFTVMPLIGVMNSTAFQFNNESAYGLNYQWDFGDGTSINTDVSPTYVYTTPFLKTVSLKAINGLYSNTSIRTNYIEVAPTTVENYNQTFETVESTTNPVYFPSVPTLPPFTQVPTTTSIDLGDQTGSLRLSFWTRPYPARFEVYWNDYTTPIAETKDIYGNKVYVGENTPLMQSYLSAIGITNTISQSTNVIGKYGSGSITFTKTSAFPRLAVVYVWTPLGNPSSPNTCDYVLQFEP